MIVHCLMHMQSNITPTRDYITQNYGQFAVYNAHFNIKTCCRIMHVLRKELFRIRKPRSK